MTAALLTVGETMGLVRGAEPGRLEQIAEMRLGIGGAESNVAIALARLGVRVRWVGRVGDDALGRRIIRELRAEDVMVEAIIDPDAPTGLMLKHSHAGLTTVSYYRAGSAGSRLEPGDIDRLDLRGIRYVHVTGITLAISPSARAAVGYLVDRVREAGCLISFDVNHRSRLWSAADAAAHYRDLAAHADILFAGDDEAEIVLGRAAPPAQMARELRALGAREVVLKLGERGCLVLAGDEEVRLPAHPVEVVDTVGAGDAFVAGYLSEALAGAGLERRARTGVIAGALACASPGDWEGSPTRDEVRAVLDAKDPVMR